MDKQQAKEALNTLNAAIGAAVVLIEGERETLEQFFEEERLMENVGPILDPSLFKDAERRAVSALLSPIYREALNLVTVYHQQLGRAADALEQVHHG